MGFCRVLAILAAGLSALSACYGVGDECAKRGRCSPPGWPTGGAPGVSVVGGAGGRLDDVRAGGEAGEAGSAGVSGGPDVTLL